MKPLRVLLKPTALIMASVMLAMSMPIKTAGARLIRTEEVIQKTKGQSRRDRLKNFLQQESVRIQMTTLGIEPSEAKERVDALSDVEVEQIAGYLDTLPAGQGIGTVLLISLLVGAVISAVLIIYYWLAVTYTEAGREKEVRGAAAQGYELNPKFSVMRLSW